MATEERSEFASMTEISGIQSVVNRATVSLEDVINIAVRGLEDLKSLRSNGTITYEDKVKFQTIIFSVLADQFWSVQKMSVEMRTILKGHQKKIREGVV